MKRHDDELHIAVLMMVKNEKKRLNVSLESIKDFADSLVIFDTGSTDNTIEICKEFCEKNNIPLRLKEGTFVNFSISRNESLEFADSFEDIDYVLLLDTNDELRNGEYLRKYAKEYTSNESSGFLIVKEWWSGSHDKYYNVRFIKAHHEWRYVGAVHEYIKTFNTNHEKHPIVKLPDNVVLYQDRTQDDDKSGKRFHRDKELLLTEYKKDPTEPRTVFYLAQTLSCLEENEESLYYYKIRATLDGFQEEKFHALLRSGELTQKLGHNWYESMTYYIKAFEFSHRVEPLLYIAIHYIQIKMWVMAYTFIKLACNLPYPNDAILFVNRNDYDYKRFHLMGIVAYYVGQYEDGKFGCINAINYSSRNQGKAPNEIDQKNLQFYNEKELEIKNQQTARKIQEQQLEHSIIKTNLVSEIITKKKFIESTISNLRINSPKLTEKQLHSHATLLWKKHQNDNKKK